MARRRDAEAVLRAERALAILALDEWLARKFPDDLTLQDVETLLALRVQPGSALDFAPHLRPSDIRTSNVAKELAARQPSPREAAKKATKRMQHLLATCSGHSYVRITGDGYALTPAGRRYIDSIALFLSHAVERLAA